MSIDTRVDPEEIVETYDDEAFARDWEDLVPADAMAAKARRSIHWVYQRRKRLDLAPRDPVPFEDPQSLHGW